MDVNNNGRNEPKDQKDKKPVKKEIDKIKNNLIKQLDELNRDLSTLKSTLISGFIIILSQLLTMNQLNLFLIILLPLLLPQKFHHQYILLLYHLHQL